MLKTCMSFIAGATLLAVSAHAATWIVIDRPDGWVLPSPSTFHFVGSSPRDGDALSEVPEKVTLNFSHTVDSIGSKIQVLNMFGTQVNEAKVITDDKTISTTLPTDLKPGRYTVKYDVRCMCDDDIDDAFDRFHFTIR